MTTVSVTDQLTLFGALGLWAAPDARSRRADCLHAGQDRGAGPGEERRGFPTSETNAESAALRYLGLPDRWCGGRRRHRSAADGELSPGDRLLAVNGTPVPTPDAVNAVLPATKPGDARPAFTRDGAAASVTVTLGSPRPRPAACSGWCRPCGRRRHLSGQPGRRRRPVGRADVRARHRRQAHPRRAQRRPLRRRHRGDRRRRRRRQHRRHPVQDGRRPGGGRHRLPGPAENCAEASPAVPGGLELVKWARWTTRSPP